MDFKAYRHEYHEQKASRGLARRPWHFESGKFSSSTDALVSMESVDAGHFTCFIVISTCHSWIRICVVKKLAVVEVLPGARPCPTGDPHPGMVPAPGTQVWVCLIPGTVGSYPAAPQYRPPVPATTCGSYEGDVWR
eukprot:Gb_21036 [translate_table: standard]